MSSLNPLLLKCPNCGAQLPPRSGSTYTCEFCQHRFEAPAPPPVPTPPMAPFGGQPAYRVYVAPRAATGAWAAFALLPAIMAIGVGVYVSTRASRAVVASGGASNPITSVGGERIVWDSVPGPPVITNINGREAFVGRYRQSSADDQLVVGAFDSATLKPIWKATGLGTYSDGHASTYYAVAASRVAVSDYRATLRLHDLTTGAETSAVKLSDRVDELCSDVRANIWVHTVDGKGVLLDAASGAQKPSPRPGFCPASSFGERSPCRGILATGAPRAACLGADKAPKASGFEARHVLAEGTAAVAVGVRSPGTAVPIAVGFELGGRAPASKWQHPIPSGDLASVGTGGVELDDLFGGRYVAPYELTNDTWRMTAFDARTGERVWDIELPKVFAINRPETMTLSPAHVFVARTSSLEVFDAKSGTLVGAIGTE